MSVEYVTVWDGTRSSASGSKYLASEEHATRPPTPIARRNWAQEILAVLSDGRARTSGELAGLLVCQASHLNTPLYHLEKDRALIVTRGWDAAADRERKWYRRAERES